VLVLKFILMMLGLDQGGADADIPGDVSADGGMDMGHSTGANLFSLQSIAGFFTMFGLVGLGLLQVRASEVLSLLGALAAGLATAWSTAMIFLNMRRLASDGTLVVSNAIGQTGTVYLTIPEKGTGVVTVTVQGTQRTLDAVAEHGQRIPTGSLVKIVSITAGKILVVSDQVAETTG
jgi:hypothetical protein